MHRVFGELHLGTTRVVLGPDPLARARWDGGCVLCIVPPTSSQPNAASVLSWRL